MLRQRPPMCRECCSRRCSLGACVAPGVAPGWRGSNGSKNRRQADRRHDGTVHVHGKASNGEGSLYRDSDGSWRATYTVAGEARRRRVRGRTRDEAIARRAESWRRSANPNPTHSTRTPPSPNWPAGGWMWSPGIASASRRSASTKTGSNGSPTPWGAGRTHLRLRHLLTRQPANDSGRKRQVRGEVRHARDRTCLTPDLPLMGSSAVDPARGRDRPPNRRPRDGELSPAGEGAQSYSA